MKTSIFKPFVIVLITLNIYTYASNTDDFTLEKESYIKLVTKKYLAQTKELIPYFDGSELFKPIPHSHLAVVMLPYATSSNENGKYINIGFAEVLSSLGHGKTEDDNWDANEIIEMYRNRMKQLKVKR